MRFAPCPTLAALLLTATPALAATSQASANGESLSISNPCARNVTITVDPSLAGRFEMTATADDPREISRLVFTGGATAHLGLPPNSACLRGGLVIGDATVFSAHPTLDITLRVPPATAIGIEEGGSTEYHIGATNAALSLDLSGSGNVTAAAINSLSAQISGSADVNVASLRGALQLQQSGSGAVHVAAADISAANLQISGSSDDTINGHIGALSLSSSGSGTLTLHGVSGPAQMDLSGSGDVTAANAQISNLKAELSGSGTLRVTGTVGNVEVENSASGDVYLPQPTGLLHQDSSGSGEVHIGNN